MEFDFSNIPRSVSCNTTPCTVYSPIPIRTPKICSSSFGFVLQKAFGSESTTESSKKSQSLNLTDKSISKKFFALAKEDLESENRKEFFPRVVFQNNTSKSQVELIEEEHEFECTLLPARVNNPQVLDKLFNFEGDEQFGMPPRNFQCDIFGETA